MVVAPATRFVGEASPDDIICYLISHQFIITAIRLQASDVQTKEMPSHLV
jgi:hypothetical protein